MKNGRYFDKNHGLTPLQNVDFFDFARVSLFRFKKHFFLSRISKNVSLWLFLLKRNIWEKGRFFDKNHGLTPLQNVDFFRLCENFTFEVQKTLFSIQNIKKCFFLASFAPKKKHMKNGLFFDKNHGLTPLQNIDFFRLFQISTFELQKALFSIQNIKKSFFLPFFAQQKHMGKRSIF